MSLSTAPGAQVLELVDGLSLDELRALTGVPLTAHTGEVEILQ